MSDVAFGNNIMMSTGRKCNERDAWLFLGKPSIGRTTLLLLLQLLLT
jgi:hypothetical protein